MADNSQLNVGIGGDVVAADDIAGVKYQRVKPVHGADGSATDTSAADPFPVMEKGGLVSTNNSSTATLAGDAVFTGTSDDLTHFSSISVSWNSDVASADGGLVMQFSTDNTNWDRSIPVSSNSNSLQTAHGGVHRLSVIARYFRVVYTNGSTIQATFRLQTLYHSTNALPLVSRQKQQISGNSDCSLVRPVTDINLDYAREHITGQKTHFFFGFNGDIGTSWEDVHATGGDVNWLTTAGKVEILSSDAADTAAGLGVRSVEVHGLSATGADQDEVIATNGTSAVQSTLDYIRVNKVHSEDCGTYGGSHQGDIICRVTGAGATLATMTGLEGAVDTSVQYGSGEAGNGYYSVPLGKVMYITQLEVEMNVKTNNTIDIALYERDGLLTTSAPFQPRRILWEAKEIDTPLIKTFPSHIKIKSLADIWFRAVGTTTGNAIEVSLDFYLLDEDGDGA